MTVLSVSPMLAVRDIDAACHFMETCLGFETAVRIEGYAFCHSDGVSVRFINAAEDADMDDSARQVAIYIDVDDVDTLYWRHKRALDALPEGQFRPPFDQDYGQREFHVIHGPFLFLVGQSLSAPAV